MVTGQRVLLIDGLPETEEVLRAVFEHRGHRIDRIRSRPVAQSHLRVETPHVIVWHADECDDDTAHIPWENIPCVVIGAETKPAVSRDASDPSTRYLPKPFQYPELVRVIEELLAARPAA